MSRVLCLDYGDSKIGVAVSDLSNTIAQSLCYIKRIGYSKDIEKIQNIMLEYDCNLVVLGLPKLMSGEEGSQALKTRAFGDELEKLGINVEYQDERLSTVAAESILIQANTRREKRKHYVDKIAASFILQMWLDKKKNIQENKNER